MGARRAWPPWRGWPSRRPPGPRSAGAGSGRRRPAPRPSLPVPPPWAGAGRACRRYGPARPRRCSGGSRQLRPARR
ncbi:hypothetical protein ACH49_29945 [Streptomyces leeuwenhoekii]|uniref:Uncharacterized protein n=1 Tax=Streptomyces leeuwenhoekii TaxID=1437453 RepID=A0ABR5HQ83_STRLW|nr:hypothetical protein ACH49_29945 [Streptomyces leeuwenhoekii]